MWIMIIYWFDFDIDPMTLVLKHDLDIVKMHVCTKNDAPTFNSSKVTAWTDTQTDRWTDTQTWLKLLPIRIRGVYWFL